jgi:hypothetical protein
MAVLHVGLSVSLETTLLETRSALVNTWFAPVALYVAELF